MIGIKVWIFKGEVFDQPEAESAEGEAAQARGAAAPAAAKPAEAAGARAELKLKVIRHMLQPKRTKYRKQFKGRISGSAQRGNSVAFGEYGLKATGRARMTAREIEAARRAMARYVKRGGQIWIRVFPDVPITKKPLEVRMGSRQGQRRVLGRARCSPARCCSRWRA